MKYLILIICSFISISLQAKQPIAFNDLIDQAKTDQSETATNIASKLELKNQDDSRSPRATFKIEIRDHGVNYVIKKVEAKTPVIVKKEMPPAKQDRSIASVPADY